MTPERKAEINRRLANFEFPNRLAGHLSEEFEITQMRYCDDLNALARLETKLPPHSWQISIRARIAEHFSYSADLIMDREVDEYGHVQPHWGGGQSEAEARAEAICQYLESR